MKSFIYSALKLSIAKPNIHCVSESITDDEQFNHINLGDAHFSFSSREDQINYLLLVAAAEGEI